ncbi:efflux RND transporter periplasmic adaptor subunit [Xanthomonas campestris pv. pennamericanum]|uniref:efflux RND transporter periplasmic adaptor subunit n=1 Tax=Xanthomonas euvesicatoria TaxID=456327 RepID=UPI001C494979|nr:efflux RND transporter periplasmic adaptor subunit [Xanthomonas euvesicatoria]MBV6809330.1 efflux RND transporter periplasmic adaptor subunit [Xanthomonas campestris pv. pennamericanum]
MSSPFLRSTLAAACVCSLLAGCGATPPPAAPSPLLIHTNTQVMVPAHSPLRASLRVQAVRSQPIAPLLQMPAVIDVLPERLVRVVPPLAGRVVALPKTLGDTVHAGDVLCVLDSAELASAYSDAGKARATLEQARLELARQKALAADSISAARDLQAAQQAFDSAQNDARAASDRLAQLGVAAQASSHRRYVVRAPIAGRVAELSAALGGFWNDTSASLMTVADISQVWLTASVPEREIGQVFEGQPVTASLDAYPGQRFVGRVQHLDDLLDPATRTLKVRVALNNRDGLLKPGMFARAQFQSRPQQALVVPDSALLQMGLYTRVFVETAPFAYRSRIVATGRAMEGYTEILSGLKAGERVVIKDGALLND